MHAHTRGAVYYLLRAWPALSLPIGSRMVQLETAIMSVPSDLALSISTLSLDMGMEKNIIERWPLTVFRMIIELV